MIHCYDEINKKKGDEDMLDTSRLRHPSLFEKVVTPEEAASLITDGMHVGVAGFRSEERHV